MTSVIYISPAFLGGAKFFSRLSLPNDWEVLDEGSNKILKFNFLLDKCLGYITWILQNGRVFIEGVCRQKWFSYAKNKSINLGAFRFPFKERQLKKAILLLLKRNFCLWHESQPCGHTMFRECNFQAGQCEWPFEIHHFLCRCVGRLTVTIYNNSYTDGWSRLSCSWSFYF